MWGEESMPKNTQIRTEWYNYKEVHQVTGHQDVIEIHQLQLNNGISNSHDRNAVIFIWVLIHNVSEKQPSDLPIFTWTERGQSTFLSIASFIVVLVSCAIDNLLIKLKSSSKGANKINFHFRLREFKMGPSISLTLMTFCWDRILEFLWPIRQCAVFYPMKKKNWSSGRLPDRGNRAVI